MNLSSSTDGIVPTAQVDDTLSSLEHGNFFYQFTKAEQKFIEEVLEGVNQQLKLAVNNKTKINNNNNNNDDVNLEDGNVELEEEKEEMEEEEKEEEEEEDNFCLLDMKKYVQDRCNVASISLNSPITFLDSVNKNMDKQLKSLGITTILQLSELKIENVKESKDEIREAKGDAQIIVEILRTKMAKKRAVGLQERIQEKIQEQWNQNVGEYVGKIATTSVKLQQISIKKIWGIKNSIWQIRNKFIVQDLNTNDIFTLELSHAGVSLYLKSVVFKLKS